LEPPEVLQSTVTVDTSSVVRMVNDHVLGVNLGGWDTYLSADTATGKGVTPDTQTLNLIQNAGLKMLRLNNGSDADMFHFSSDNNDHPVGAGLLANMTAAAGADGFVTVNYGTGTPEEAAAYLAYLNGTTDNAFAIGVDANGTDWGTVSDWATLRGETPIGGDPLDVLRAGHPSPFGFSHFEVGNEVYFGKWLGAPNLTGDPAAFPKLVQNYATFVEKFADLAVSIDPSALIGVGLGNPIEYDANWNIPLLQRFNADGRTPGFLSDHFYVYDGNNETLSDSELLTDSVTTPGSTMPIHAFAPRNWADRAAAYRSLLTDELGPSGESVELICAEFSSDADASNKQSTSLIRGLFLADAIGGVLQTEYNGVISWDLRNSYNGGLANDPTFYGWRKGSDAGMIGTDSGMAPATGPYVPYPTYFAEQLVSKMVHTGDRVVKAASDNADLSAYAVLQGNGHLALLIINKAPVENNVTFNISGFVPANSATAFQYGEAEDTAQSLTADGSSSLTTSIPRFAVVPTGMGGQFGYIVPGYSMTVLDLLPEPDAGGP
jgi:hypothetical protein